jgi:hypothetical protein
MPCGSCGGRSSAAVTSAEVAEAGRFKVTRADGHVETFATYEQATTYQNTNGGHLDVVKR